MRPPVRRAMSIIEKLLCERGYYNMRLLTKVSAVASKRATFRRLAVIKQEANKCVANIQAAMI